MIGTSLFAGGKALAKEHIAEVQANLNRIEIPRIERDESYEKAAIEYVDRVRRYFAHQTREELQNTLIDLAGKSENFENFRFYCNSAKI